MGDARIFGITAMLLAALFAAASVRAEGVHPRIINGSSVEPGSSPWMASLHFTGVEPFDPLGGGHFCGAVLIHPRYLLTSAHCVLAHKNAPSAVSATLGRTVLSDTSAGTTVGVESIHLHPDYDNAALDFDLAVVKLAAPVEFAPRAVLSPREGGVQSGASGEILGWGVKDSGLAIATPTDILQRAAVPVPPESSCTVIMGQAFHSESMLCAGQLATAPGSGDGIDGCYGDSGGPLLATVPGAGERVVGISSWGYDDCASSDFYGVYARVDAAASWIYSVVPFPPKQISLPTVTGILESGRVIGCNPGEWDGSLLSYRFKFESSNGEVLADGDSSQFLLGRAQLNKRIRCAVTASGPGGVLEAVSQFAGPVKSGLAPTPTPSPSRDKTPPIILRVRKVCNGESCKLSVTGKDPGAHPSGLAGIKAKGSWSGLICPAAAPLRCKPGRKKIVFTISQPATRRFVLTFPAPRTGSFSTQLRLLDAAGNRSAVTRYRWERLQK